MVIQVLMMSKPTAALATRASPVWRALCSDGGDESLEYLWMSCVSDIFVLVDNMSNIYLEQYKTYTNLIVQAPRTVAGDGSACSCVAEPGGSLAGQNKCGLQQVRRNAP